MLKQEGRLLGVLDNEVKDAFRVCEEERARISLSEERWGNWLYVEEKLGFIGVA